jgi:hypothetical protein
MSNRESTATSDESDTAGALADVKPARRLERWLDTTTRKVLAVVAAVSAVIGLVLGLLALWDRIHQPTESIGATIDVLERPLLNQTLGQFLRAHPGAFDGSFSSARRGSNGVVYTVRIGLKGLEDKEANVAWTQLDGSTSEVLPVPSWVPRRMPLAAESDDDELTRDVWVPIPRRGDSMVVRFRVTVPERSEPLEVEDSPTQPIG